MDTTTRLDLVRILTISSDPQDKQRLRLATERRELVSALRGTRAQARFSLHDLGSCRIQDITLALDEYKPTILHFSGHGDPAGILFEDDIGRAILVDKTRFGALLGSQVGLELVVLNACYSGEQAQAIADAVGYVIGNEGVVKDEDAITFTRELYRALGDGRNYEDAYDRARLALELQLPSVGLKLLKGCKWRSKFVDEPASVTG